MSYARILNRDSLDLQSPAHDADVDEPTPYARAPGLVIDRVAHRIASQSHRIALHRIIFESNQSYAFFCI